MTKRRPIMLLAIGAAVIATAAAGLFFLTPSDDAPEDRALAVMQALATGDPETIAAAGVELEESAIAALSGATGLIEDPAVVSASAHDGDPVVSVSYTLDGEQHRAALPMTRVGGSLVPEPDALFAAVTADAPMMIGDALIPASTPTLLIPAVYEASAAPADFLAGEARISALAGADIMSPLDAELLPEASSLAQSRLDAYATDCATASDIPGGCGIVLPWAADLRDVDSAEMTIERFPSITLSETSFLADDGILIAVVHGTGHDGKPLTATYRTESWTLRGDVSFTADTIVLSVW
ncbi:hypothetical protein [uncultured Microbacterium sp.]|uniref:hypothetical protein n=1 Tax=uncultured Microbacterium sp. TaxID=191216 RepID=UPI0026129E34|nr:hypothetical protein [uncultured Microbacterium sp.]